MTRPRIYIDGQEGTTGLRIRQMLENRQDLELLLIPPEERKNPQVRAGAAAGLSANTDARSLELLLKAVVDPDESVRRNAAEALASFSSPRAIEPLLQALRLGYTEREITDMRLGRALKSIGEPAVGPLIVALRENNAYLQRGVSLALGGLGFHGQRVGQEFGQGVDGAGALHVILHSANLASSSATEPSVCSNSGRNGGREPLYSTLPTLKPSSVIRRRAARAASSV